MSKKKPPTESLKRSFSNYEESADVAGMVQEIMHEVRILRGQMEELAEHVLELDQRVEGLETNTTSATTDEPLKLDLGDESLLKDFYGRLKEKVPTTCKKMGSNRRPAFKGCDAVDVMLELLDTKDREDAVRFGQALFENRYITHVKRNKFIDGTHFFEWGDVSDDDKESKELVVKSSDDTKPEAFIGQLRLWIDDAVSHDNVKTKFLNKGSNYYFKITCDGQTIRSKSISYIKSKGWTWGTFMYFLIFHSNQEINVALWRKSSLGKFHKDHLLYESVLLLDYLSPGIPADDYFDLRSAKADRTNAGKVKLRLQYSYLQGKDTGKYLTIADFPNNQFSMSPKQLVAETYKRQNAMLPGHKTHRCGIDDVVLLGSGDDRVAVELVGNFRYGYTRINDGAYVELFIQEPDSYFPIGEWKHHGTARTQNGAAKFNVDRKYFAKPGRYQIQMIVRRDHSSARGSVWVLKPGTSCVVYDIDGTLTVGDHELVTQLAIEQVSGNASNYNPTPRNGAVAMVRSWYAKGYLPVYLSGRAGTYYHLTWKWLHKRGFPPGLIGHTNTAVPTLPIYHVPGSKTIGVGNFKTAYIKKLREEYKLDVGGAYGNTSNDVAVYTKAKFNKDRTFIVGGLQTDTATCLPKDYLLHMQWLDEKLKKAPIPCPTLAFDWPLPRSIPSSGDVTSSKKKSLKKSLK